MDESTNEVTAEIEEILSKLGKQNILDKVLKSYRTIINEAGLISLDLIGLGIHDLPLKIFDRIISVRQLYLSWNSIETLSMGIFDKLINLQHLDLRGAGLTIIEKGVLDNLTNLQRLELNDNSLTAIPNGTFDKLVSIQELNLSNNRIEKLDPKIFDNLNNLNYLYLYFNPLPGDISLGNYYDREAVLELIDLLKIHFKND
ncbi:MAG: leucine-rich repeat domain-containing protein [Candidatus Kariarchaeaceae archaeon]